MRLAVQQLLASTRSADRAAKPAERVAEEFAVRTEQRWRPLLVVDLASRIGDSIREVRRIQIKLAQGGMQPHKCVRVCGWRDLRSRWLVVRPERDGEAIPDIGTAFGPGIKLGNRAAGFGETAGNLYFELRVSPMRCRRDPSHNVAREQAQRDAVRVMYDHHVVGLKA